MPPLARFIIALCVGVPAVLARIGGMIWTCFAGILLLVDQETRFSILGMDSGPRATSPRLFMIALAVSVLGYLVEVGVAYINSQQRQAVPPREVAVLIILELTVQLLGIAAACFLIAAVFAETAATPLGHPTATVAGAVCGGAALFLTIRYRQRTNYWRAMWKAPAIGGFDLNK